MTRQWPSLLLGGALLLACGGTVADKAENNPGATSGGDGGAGASNGSLGSLDAGAASVGATCGTARCAADEYCKVPTNRSGFGSCDTQGAGATCAERPTACDDNSDPVCGCDGKTYENACEAEADGVSIRHWASCGSFRCGMSWCDAHTSYCSYPLTDAPKGEPKCQPLPPSCVSSGGKMATCTCFPPTPCPMGAECNQKCTAEQVDGLPGFTLQ